MQKTRFNRKKHYILFSIFIIEYKISMSAPKYDINKKQTDDEKERKLFNRI